MGHASLHAISLYLCLTMVLLLHPLKEFLILCHCLIKIWQYHCCWDSIPWTVLQLYTLYILCFSAYLWGAFVKQWKTFCTPYIFSIFSHVHDIAVPVHEATHIYHKPSVSMPLHDFYLIMINMAGTYHGESDCWLYSHFYYMHIVMVLLSTFIWSSEMALTLFLFLF